MIVKNKTSYSQKVTLPDGSVQVARPYRTLSLDEKLASGLDSNVWEVPKAEKKAKVAESAPEGK